MEQSSILEAQIICMRLLLFMMCLWSLFSCGSVDKTDAEKKIFRYNESAGIHSFDPAFAKDQARIWFCNQVYNSLVQLDSTLQVQPSIAKNWSISADGLQYQFMLREDVYFHPSAELFGSKGYRAVSVDDVVYSLSRLLDDKIASPGSWVLSSVNRIYSLNDSTVSIDLTSPNPAFLGMISMQYCSIIPIESDTVTNFFETPIGTGPFHFQYHKNNVKLVLRKHQNYFEFEGAQRLPYIDAVSVRFIPDKQTAFLEFIKGNFDFLSGIDASYKDELLDREGGLREKYRNSLKSTKQDYLNTEYLGILMNEDQSNSALKDLRVRKALNLSFDRSQMMQYLRNNIGTPANAGFIPKGLSGYQEGIGYEYDPEYAKKLLSDAGYPNAEGIPEIELNTTSSYLDLCEYIQHAWQSLGFKVAVNVSPPSTHRQQVSNSQLSIFRGSWIADYADAENYLALFYSKNHSPNGPNYTHFSNDRFDSLYEQSLAISELSDRIPLYEEMDRILMDQATIIPLYYDNVMRFYHSYLTGLGSNPMNLLDLKRVQFNTEL